MKKNLFIYAALCALVATGCSKQDEAETLQPGQGEAIDITISATRHEAPSTRTEYEEAADRLIVKWSSDRSDKLRVFTTGNGTPSTAQFTVDGDLSADGKTAHFKGTLNVSTPGQETTVYGYYPYSTAGHTTTEIPINLSGQRQDGITDNASLAHLSTIDYMAATPVTKKLSSGSQKLSLEFNPLLTIMSFKITQAINVKSIKLEAVGTTNLTPFYTQGTVNITTADQTFPITPGGTAQSSVELNVTNGTISTTGMFNMMIFPIIAGAMPSHFKATVTTTDGDIYEQTKEAPAGFERGKRYIMALDNLTEETFDVWDGNTPTADDTYAYSGGDGTVDNPYQIAKANDLAQLAVNVTEKFDASDNFILTKNINLNGHEWTPIGQSGATFKGTFDGGGKVITGMKITELKQHAGLFGLVETGTIKDISVAGEINISKETALTIYAGGILGYCYGATLSGNLTNHVNITIATTSGIGGGTLYIGGVTGRTRKAVADATLVNDGILNINGCADVKVGGIIGEAFADIEQGATLTNNGAVSGTSSGGVCCVGGLIGYSTAVLCKGTNTGNVMGKSGYNSVYSGGFIGYTTGAVTIESILNAGTVTAESTATIPEVPSYAGIRVGGAESSINLVDANRDADGKPGSTVGITATAINGNKSYVNGVELVPTDL